MKVLFAVNNDEISNAIVKKYQKEYKEILSYKNVYYFNAIIKELQKDKTYDRVVISEDLEPFANNNYDTIDKFLFEKLDAISDETTNAEGNDIDIILICTDRRTKADDMLIKLFGIGIYSAIVGADRSIDEVCKLINMPRTKKDAKFYYRIESENVSYQAEKEDSVSEIEVQNILAHYKRLGKNEDKYVDSFNNIVSQYTDNQLKIIIRYLPMGVKAVLEEKSPKYQQLVDVMPKNDTSKMQFNNYKSKPEEKIKMKMIESESTKSKIVKPIVIPSNVNTKYVKKAFDENIADESIKDEIIADENISVKLEEEPMVENKKGRGRPRKNPIIDENIEDKPKRGRGRPRKNFANEESEDKDSQDSDSIDLFDLDNENISEKIENGNEDELDLFGLDEENNNNSNEKEVKQDEDELDLFGLDEENNNNSNEKEVKQDEDELDLFGLDEENSNNSNGKEVKQNDDERDLFNLEKDIEEDEEDEEDDIINAVEKISYKPANDNFGSLITKDKKIVSFVGTTKNGTSFVVNNAAHMLASIGINTAILDVTKTKNAYYIYTNSEEKLMNIAKQSIAKLKSGVAEGVRINKNLSVYTSLPESNEDYSNVSQILSTLIKNYDVVLIDCDFETPIEFFDSSQELYLVQSMDVLTMQPLTAFLRNLQSKGVLKQEKIKIVINKGVKIKSVSIKTLIGGISKYNDPSMTYMKELFDKDKVNYCVLPFETENYIRYLDSVIECSISLNKYTKNFMEALKELCNMIYPLIGKQIYTPRGERYKDSFSPEMNSTLNKMKRNYN